MNGVNEFIMDIKIENSIFKDKFNLFFCLLWGLIVFFILLHHEPWGDEVRPLFFCETNSLTETVKIAKGEGHAALWHIILYPFVKLGFNYIAMQIISFLFVFAAVIIIFTKSRFNNLLKIFICYSAGMIYFLPIIARCYCLMPILILLCAICYKDRLTNPFRYSFSLILLSQTHSLLWFFCLVCSCIFLFEKIYENIYNFRLYGWKKCKNQFLQVTLLITLFLVYLFIMIIFFKDVAFNPQIPQSAVYIDFSYSNFINGINIILTESLMNNSFKYIFLSTVIVFLIILFKTDKKIFLITSSSLISGVYFFTKVYTGVRYQKFFIFMLFIIFAIWTIEKQYHLNSKVFSICINLMFLLIFINPFFLKFAIDDLQNQYTNTKDVACYLKNNNVNNEEIASFVIYYPNLLVYNYLYKFSDTNYISTFGLSDEDVKNYKINLLKFVEENPQIKYIIVNNSQEFPELKKDKYNIVLKAPDKRCIPILVLDYPDEFYNIYKKIN